MSDARRDAARGAAWERLAEVRSLDVAEGPEGSIAAFDRLAGEFAGDPDPYLRSVAADALIGKAWALEEGDRLDEAMAAFDDARRLAGSETDPDLRNSRAFAEYGLGWVLNRAGNFEDAAVLLADLFNGFVDEPPLAGIQPIVDAELLLGGLALHFGHPDKAIETYEDVVERFGDVAENRVQSAVLRALISKAGILARLEDRNAEAILVCDEVLARAGRWPESAELAAERAIALTDKGRWLRSAGRADEAAAVYRRAVEEFDDADDPEIDQRLTFAREELSELDAS
ncbi:MAG TPA: tetratricopeptide repeat protein [Acidimicrobiales bacterium]|nr:tetratricopeptide repeat protein [Acidimicrobiales bacterium]